MKATLAFWSITLISCGEAPELLQAERATSEEREAYRRKIDKLFQKEVIFSRALPPGEPNVWVHEGRKVREATPNRLVPAVLKLPARSEITRIEFKNLDPYWVLETPAEIDRFYECVARESRMLVEPETARYFFLDGSSFEVRLQREVFSHACAMGLYFYGGEKLLYEISGHPRCLEFELRHSKEKNIRNPALNDLIEDYCRRSPAYQKVQPKD
jgi:hypothetical protein